MSNQTNVLATTHNPGIATSELWVVLVAVVVLPIVNHFVYPLQMAEDAGAMATAFAEAVRTVPAVIAATGYAFLRIWLKRKNIDIEIAAANPAAANAKKEV